MSNNLPVLLTPLLGRERETATLQQLVCRPGIRLVTITGPSGVGKTSLALHVARAAPDAFADGFFFVSLAPTSDPVLIIEFGERLAQVRTLEALEAANQFAASVSQTRSAGDPSIQAGSPPPTGF